MADTAIEWATKVWNPTTGCDRVSPGCDHCYALTMAKRLKGMGSAKYQNDGDPRTSGPGFAATHHSSVVSEPSRWKKPQRVFVNSMSDLFHDDIPDQFIAAVWDTMRRNPQHTFMVLTKRHARMRSLLSSLEFQEMNFRYGGVGAEKLAESPYLKQYRVWPLPNVWLGVSAENQQWAKIRGAALRDTPAAVRFFSCEPLIGPIDNLNLSGIGWVIVGGESGHGARPMRPDWARNLRDQCQVAKVPFLYKQWGEWAPAPWHGENGATHAFTGGLYQNDAGEWVENFMGIGHSPTSSERDLTTPPGAQGMRRVGKKAAGRELDGRTWDQYPEQVTV